MHCDRNNPLRPYWYGVVGAALGSTFCLFVVPMAAFIIPRLAAWLAG